MVKDAPISMVLKNEYDVDIDTPVPSGTWIDLYYDAEFSLPPDLSSITNDAGVTPTEVVKGKGKLRVKFNGEIASGKKIHLKIKPKRMI